MNYFSRVGALIFTGLALTASLFAQFGTSPPSPTYNYPVSVVQGNQPLVAGSAVLAGSDPINLIISQPASGMAGVTYPLTIKLAVTIPTLVGANPGVPLGVSTATAIGYCTLSSASVTFSGPTATAQVIVSVNVPTPVVSGDYYWKIAGTNWPAGVSDPGAIINATVLPPIVNPTVPPTITNLLPSNGTSFVYYAPTPVSIPISFNATSVSAASGGAAITSLRAQFDTTVLTLSTTGLGTTNPDNTFSAAGSVTSLIADSGPHTITVSATNAAGTTTARTQINILAPPAITNTNNPTFAYGQPGSFNVTWTGYENPTFSLVSGALPAGVTVNPTTGVISGTPTAGSGSSFTFTIKAINSVGSATHTFTLVVNRALLTVMANAISKTYSAGDPALTYSFAPALVAGNSFTGALVRAAGENVGTYAITQGTLNAGANYTITFVGANFTISPATLNVAAANATKVYGAANPSFTSTITGFVNNDSPSVVSGTAAITCAATSVSPVGNYTITTTVGSLTAANYAFSFTNGTLSVTKAALTVMANDASRVVGAANPAFTAKISGFVNGDTMASSVTGAPAFSTTALPTSPAGTYPITPSIGSLASLNYSFPIFLPGTLTVGAAQTCPASIMWLEPISLNKIRQGGSVLPIKFHLEECCGNSPRDPDSNGDYHSNDHNGHGDDNGDDDGSHDDDDHTSSTDDYSGNNVSCHHDSDGRSTNNQSCRHDCDHDDDDAKGCATLRDKTVVISIYEIGSKAPATQYKYGTNSPNPPDYVINGDYKYQLNFPTAKGAHTYHIDVYRFPAGSTIPTVVGSKEFTTK